jgi:hypothetical protein
MIATKKMIFANSNAVPAIAPKPSTPAIKATIRKVIAQPIMIFLRFHLLARQAPSGKSNRIVR